MVINYSSYRRLFATKEGNSRHFCFQQNSSQCLFKCSSGSTGSVSGGKTTPSPIVYCLEAAWCEDAAKQFPTISRTHTHTKPNLSLLLYFLSLSLSSWRPTCPHKALSVCLYLFLLFYLSAPPPRTVWPSDLCTVGCCSVEESVGREREGQKLCSREEESIE